MSMDSLNALREQVSSGNYSSRAQQMIADTAPPPTDQSATRSTAKGAVKANAGEQQVGACAWVLVVALVTAVACHARQVSHEPERCRCDGRQSAIGTAAASIRTHSNEAVVLRLGTQSCPGKFTFSPCSQIFKL
jgi:hypothetical protein